MDNPPSVMRMHLCVSTYDLRTELPNELSRMMMSGLEVIEEVGTLFRESIIVIPGKKRFMAMKLRAPGSLP